jgi:hypothetical protein
MAPYHNGLPGRGDFFPHDNAQPQQNPGVGQHKEAEPILYFY